MESDSPITRSDIPNRPVSPGTNDSVGQSKEYQDAYRAYQAGNFPRAGELGAVLATRFPDSVDVSSLRAAIAVASRDFRTALVYIEEAQRRDPRNAGILAHKANTLAVLRMYREALATADEALGLDPDRGETLATLGTVYTKCSKHERSQKCFRKAAELSPDNPNHQYNLGTSLRFTGDFAGAERCFDRTIELRPDDYETYFARSGLRTQTDSHNHVAELEEQLAIGPQSWRGESLIGFALAKELEDLEQWDRSFHYLKRGADRRRENLRYDVGKDSEKMSKVAAAFDEVVLSRNSVGCETTEPIFILGLPRAGSTLFERVLSSHSCVTSAGELQNFSIELMRPIHAKLKTTKVPIDVVIEESLQLDYLDLGQSYLDSTRDVTGSSKHFIDKMPLNYLYVGLIHMALPNSKIIHVHRNPMDACFAMYKMIFKGAYPFSYNLDDLGRYYVAYHRLMTHWNACIPDRIINVRYEDLVSDQEQTTRQLLDFCDLDWEDACMSFHELDTAATTASAVDVRQPIYSSSVDKWKHYRRHLEGLELHLKTHHVIG